MSPFEHDLPPEALAIVSEEERLLDQVLEAITARRSARERLSPERNDRDLLERLQQLRDEAAKAAAHDLPTLFQEMSLVRALLEHTPDAELPDARSPYFAHLRLEEADGVRDFCLGRQSFFDTLRGVRLLDWRDGPIARLFYRHREGDPFEVQLPGRFAEGAVLARRIVVVHNGRLSRIRTPEWGLCRSEEGRWLLEQGAGAFAGGGSGTAARPGSLGIGREVTAQRGRLDISALLDREQFEAIQEAPNRPLLVLGSAGSGKTTVALHRLARLAFEQPDRYPPERMEVVVPEPGLAALSRRLLEPLGLDRVRVRTLDLWAKETARRVFQQPALKLCEEAPPLVVRLKRHPSLYHALRHHLMRSPSKETRWYPLRHELAELLTDRLFLKRIVENAKGGLPLTAIDETVRHALNQLAVPGEGLSTVEGFDAVDGRPLDDATPEMLAGTTDLEDLPILMLMHAWRSGRVGGEERAHIVVDEAEDLSLFELFVLGGMLGRHKSITLAGDEAQQTHSSFGGWEEALFALGAERAATCRLQTTYRCPEPIATLARAVLGPLAPPEPGGAGRPGVPVGRFEFPSRAHASLFVVDALRELLDREPDASVGVVAHSTEAAEAFHALLADLPQARLVLDGAFSFRPGIDATTVGSVKGLEFDYVVLPDASLQTYPDDEESRRRLHVALTRASHQLWVVSVGTPSPLLPRPSEAGR